MGTYPQEATTFVGGAASFVLAQLAWTGIRLLLRDPYAWALEHPAGLVLTVLIVAASMAQLAVRQANSGTFVAAPFAGCAGVAVAMTVAFFVVGQGQGNIWPIALASHYGVVLPAALAGWAVGFAARRAWRPRGARR